MTYWTSVVKKDGIFPIMLIWQKTFQVYLMFSVFINIDCNKRGQTSCLVARALMQTNQL